MDDLRVQEQQKTQKKMKWKIRLILFWKKQKWWLLSFLIILIFILYPEQSGQTIGQWIHDFVGNLVKYSKF